MICADEFAMAADEAFALSPISARASLPREEDYEAISEAFMETSRGRWFLGEYAKRNRNADTHMVLDAVARIEHSLAAQKQPAPDSGLADARAAIRGALDEARARAAAALDGLALDENLAPVRKGARVIREIAWRLREIGADGRICDLLDSQVSSIEAGCGQISSTGPEDALSTAFDLIEERIAEFGDSDAAAPQPAEEVRPSPSHSPAPSDEMSAASMEMAQATTEMDNANAAMSARAMPTEAAVATAEAADETVEAADVTAEAAAAYDDALLDMVALEMGAPDPADPDDTSDIDSDEIHVANPPPADPVIVAQKPEPTAAPVQPLAIQPSLQLSLGSTLIASGIVRRPNASVPDPLAAIRRMSQAEKIAFFSGSLSAYCAKVGTGFASQSSLRRLRRLVCGRIRARKPLGVGGDVLAVAADDGRR